MWDWPLAIWSLRDRLLSFNQSERLAGDVWGRLGRVVLWRAPVGLCALRLPSRGRCGSCHQRMSPFTQAAALRWLSKPVFPGTDASDANVLGCVPRTDILWSMLPKLCVLQPRCVEYTMPTLWGQRAAVLPPNVLRICARRSAQHGCLDPLTLPPFTRTSLSTSTLRQIISHFFSNCLEEFCSLLQERPFCFISSCHDGYKFIFHAEPIVVNRLSCWI